MKKENCFNLGKITRLFGTKGELTLLLDVDDPNDYAKLDFFYVDIDGDLVPFFVEKLTFRNNNTVIVKLIDHDDPQEAEKLINHLVYLSLDKLPQLKDDQFYFHEIIGYRVIDDTIGDIGFVKDVLELPMQELIQIDKDGKEILIPVADELIEKVDRENKILYISAPEGLIEIYLD
jgi:16S rRNA processing protein RimM